MSEFSIIRSKNPSLRVSSTDSHRISGVPTEAGKPRQIQSNANQAGVRIVGAPAVHPMSQAGPASIGKAVQPPPRSSAPNQAPAPAPVPTQPKAPPAPPRPATTAPQPAARAPLAAPPAPPAPTVPTSAPAPQVTTAVSAPRTPEPPQFTAEELSFLASCADGFLTEAKQSGLSDQEPLVQLARAAIGKLRSMIPARPRPAASSPAAETQPKA